MFLHSEKRFYAEKSKVATEAERCASAAAGGGSDAGADAGGSRLQAQRSACMITACFARVLDGSTGFPCVHFPHSSRA